MHSKLEPGSVEEKEKLALVEVVVPDGPEPIVVSGGVVSGGGVSEVDGVGSTAQVSAAGDGSTFPEASTARTEKLCVPRLTEYDFGEPQDRHLAASSLHSNFEPDSVDVKAKFAEVTVVLANGSAVIVVSGGTLSQTRRWWTYWQPALRERTAVRRPFRPPDPFFELNAVVSGSR